MSEVSEQVIGKPSPKQQRFIEEYMIDLNGTAAAIRTGYSPKTARVQAAKMLTIPIIKSSVLSLKAERAQRLRVDADEVLENWVLFNRSNIADYLDAAGNVDLSQCTRDQLQALSEYSTDVTTDSDGKRHVKTKIRLVDRLRSSEMTAKHIGLFEADNRQKADKPAMTEEEAQAAIVAVLDRMKAPPVIIEGDAEDGEFVVIPES